MFWKGFTSDNYAGIQPDILKAIVDANQGHSKAYGADYYTQQAVASFKQHFGNAIDVYFVCNGTAANVLALSAFLKPYEGVICAQSSHINEDECGAFEKYTGSKLLSVPTKNGKLTIDLIKGHLAVCGDQHKVQPKVISISQSTEWATIYTVDEIKEITRFAHEHNLFVHMDGTRLSNAAAHLKVSLAALTQEAGIDILCFGGTKSGLMYGDAIVFFNKEHSKGFKFVRKQGMQLLSKMRFVSAQFNALLTDDLWLKNALHANAMAEFLAKEVQKIESIKISQKVQANAVFAIIDPELIPTLQTKYPFYVWDENLSEVRWMTSWDTTKEEIEEFVDFIKASIGSLQLK